ncbi:MAG TPA: ornithine cyclodeaminase family protein [Myxococcaceae bacterium]|nr:ornithine cyclodeaminase family protein [Myxococcaceae bacterium]
MATLVLTHADVSRYLNALYLLQDLREAFRTDALARTVSAQTTRAVLHTGGTVIAGFPGSLPGVPAFSVRITNRFPAQEPPERDFIQLFDLLTGELLAVMEAGHLVPMRAAVVGALAADVLARADAKRVALIGAGKDAAIHLKSLRLVRSLQHVRIFDPDMARAAALSFRLYSTLSLPSHAASSVAEAVEDADIVITTGSAREGALLPEMVRPGTHVTLGTDEPSRTTPPPGLLERAAFFCDSRQSALATGAIPEGAIHAELGEVIAGTRGGRSSPDQVTVFAELGQPFQDLAAAWQVYEAAKQDDLTQRVELGA